MSEDQAASAVESAPEGDSVIPNGKGHEPSEATATSVPPAGNEEKWVFPQFASTYFSALKFLTGSWSLPFGRLVFRDQMCMRSHHHVAIWNIQKEDYHLRNGAERWMAVISPSDKRRFTNLNNCDLAPVLVTWPASSTKRKSFYWNASQLKKTKSRLIKALSY